LISALQLSLKLLTALVLALLVLFGALWLWSGAGTSLSTLVNQLLPYLPAGQTLEINGITGSVRDGGHIDRLRWSQGSLSVEAHDVQLAWSLRPLVNGVLQLDQLNVQTLRIEDRRLDHGAPTPPTALILPLQVISPF
jgi:translocation and assembly module TamB